MSVWGLFGTAFLFMCGYSFMWHELVFPPGWAGWRETLSMIKFVFYSTFVSHDRAFIRRK